MPLTYLDLIAKLATLTDEELAEPIKIRSLSRSEEESFDTVILFSHDENNPLTLVI